MTALPSLRYVSIATSDPILPDDELRLTDRRFPPTAAGWKAAKAACDEYHDSHRTADNYTAWPVLVVPDSDGRTVRALRRLARAVLSYRGDPTDDNGDALHAEAFKALIVLGFVDVPGGLASLLDDSGSGQDESRRDRVSKIVADLAAGPAEDCE